MNSELHYGFVCLLGHRFQAQWSHIWLPTTDLNHPASEGSIWVFDHSKSSTFNTLQRCWKWTLSYVEILNYLGVSVRYIVYVNGAEGGGRVNGWTGGAFNAPLHPNADRWPWLKGRRSASCWAVRPSYASTLGNFSSGTLLLHFPQVFVVCSNEK